MRRSEFGIRIGLGILTLLLVAGGAWATLEEPSESGDYRGLRSDYVREWYIFSDTLTDGVLDPGDTYIATMKNWWTVESSGTQHNMIDGPYNPGGYVYGNDTASGPMNFATHDASKNVWLPMKEDRLNFYMTYSQRDNNDPTSWGSDALGKYMTERHGVTNGWALGWVVDNIKRDPITNEVIPDTSFAGIDKMDIYIHDGKFNGVIPGFGTSTSNPLITQSNDMSKLAKEPNQFVIPASQLYTPPQYNDTSHTYDPASNVEMKNWWPISSGGAVTLTDADIATIAASMEVKEVDPDGSGVSWNAIFAGKTPDQIRDSAVIQALLAAGGSLDPAVTKYLYQDAFINRGTYVENSNDGGVIGGLAGLTDYNPVDNNWADQQVIRIDVSEEMLGVEGSLVNEIAFYDFGNSIPGGVGVGQVNPVEILFGVDLAQTVAHGQIFHDANKNGAWDPGETWFPENRIYIAQVNIPEPGMMLLLGLGGAALILRRNKRRK